MSRAPAGGLTTPWSAAMAEPARRLGWGGWLVGIVALLGASACGGEASGDADAADAARDASADSATGDATPSDALADGGAGWCSLEREGQPCDDGDPCTLDDRCAGGRCVGGDGLACDDPDPCRVGRCEPGQGCVYEARDEGASCSLACFTRASCQGGRCTPEAGAAKPCPAPADPCVDHLSCDAGTGECSVPIYAPAGAPCDRDGDACTVDECDGAGACRDTQTLETCAAQSAHNPCWTYSCVKATGCVRAAFVEGASCDDLNPCTSGDVCLVNALGQQTCLGTPLPIDDANPCTDDTCVGGVIGHAPVDGIACAVADDLCVGVGLCDQGACVAPPAVDCDDGDPCTLDTCAPATGACAHEPAPAGAPCDDGDVCTSLDRCVGGVCAGALVANCCGNGVCEPGEGCACGDCNGQPCEDGDACTSGDVCAGGACRPGALLAGCCGNGVCEAGEGCGCADCDGQPCDDGDMCTSDDRCDGGQCRGTVVFGCCGNGLCELGELCGCADCDGQPCEDGDACTSGDTCGGGACQPGTLLAGCCGNGTCEPGEGCGCDDCDGQACDDGEACTDGDTCSGGACQPGALLAGCCGNGICEPGEGCGCGDCAGEPCDEGPACSAGATCAGGVCQGWTLLADCCGNGVCDGDEGCDCADCLGAPCDDGDVCTSGDVCGAGGGCAGTATGPCCDDGICAADETCACPDCAATPACAFIVPAGFTAVSDTQHIGGHGTLTRLDDEHIALAYTDVADPSVAPDHFKVRVGRLVAGELQLGPPLSVSADMRALASNSTWLSDIGLMGALGATHFVLHTWHGKFRLFKRDGMNLQQVAVITPLSETTGWWAGHPLDATRYLLRYRVYSSDAPVTYRVLSRSGDSLSLSFYSRQRPGAASFPGLDPTFEPQTHAPLMRVGPTTFREIRGGYVRLPGYLASWKLSASSSSLSASDIEVYPNSMTKTLSPLVVANGSGSGIVFYQAYGDGWYWGRISGASASFSPGGYLHENMSWNTGQNRESTDGYVGGRYFLRGVNGTLYRFDTLTSPPAVVETDLDWSFCRNTPPLVTLQGHAIMMTCGKTKPLLVRVLDLQ